MRAEASSLAHMVGVRQSSLPCVHVRRVRLILRRSLSPDPRRCGRSATLLLATGCLGSIVVGLIVHVTLIVAVGCSPIIACRRDLLVHRLILVGLDRSLPRWVTVCAIRGLSNDDTGSAALLRNDGFYIDDDGCGDHGDIDRCVDGLRNVVCASDFHEGDDSGV